MRWEWRNGKHLRYLYIPEWEEIGVQAAFTSRQGGFSNHPFHSLNMGLHVGDDPVAVVENRRLWLQEWDCDENRCVIGEQVHGVNTAWVGQAEGGKGFETLASAIPQVDALLTSEKGIGLMAFFADCIPILFYHPGINAVAIAHAGWKGTVGKIAGEVLRRFQKAGGKPEECQVAIGPGIGACCYEVDETVVRKFAAEFASIPFLKAGRPGHYFLDLEEGNYQTLVEDGVRAENIARAGLCTACHGDEFFSHRRDGKLSGRMAGWIRLRDRGTSHDQHFSR